MDIIEIYRPPFRSDGSFIYSSNDIMSLMPATVKSYPEKMLARTCEILNGYSKPFGTADIGCENGEIYVNGSPLLVVRGWGYLTGVGGLNLSAEQASLIQDEFAIWVVRKLRGEI